MPQRNGADYGADSVVADSLMHAGHASTPDLNELRAFCVAADLGTLGRAAVRLHVSQPSLSKRLAALEAKVGVQLLSARRAASS